jgi:hypothetical protein
MSTNKQYLGPNAHLNEAVGILKACLPLIKRLSTEYVTLDLNSQEKASLLNYKKLVEADYKDSEWSYLRVAAGVQISSLTALTSLLTRFQASQK